MYRIVSGTQLVLYKYNLKAFSGPWQGAGPPPKWPNSSVIISPFYRSSELP